MIQLSCNFVCWIRDDVSALNIYNTIVDHVRTILPEQLFDEAVLYGTDTDQQEDWARYEECIEFFQDEVSAGQKEIYITQWFRFSSEESDVE